MMEKFNFYLGASVSAWLLAGMVIFAELSEPFKTLLKTTFVHHWIGKAVITALSFIVFGFLFARKKSLGNVSSENVAWYSVHASLGIIFLFYVIEFFR